MRLILAFALFTAALFAQTVTTMRGPDGVERSYTLQPWPYRIYITPEIHNRIKDPDGAGSGKNALYDAIEGQGLIYAINSARTGSDFLNNYPNGNNNPGVYAEYAALLYTMCNQCTTTWDAGTTWLQYAKTILLNNYAYSNKKFHGFYTYGDSAAVAYGYNGANIGETDADYQGPFPMHGAQAYVLIRDQFTSEQQALIASYYVNGLLPEDLCTLPLERQVGVVTKVGTTYTVTGNTWDGVSVGDLIVVNGYRDASGNVITTAQCQSGSSCSWSWTGKVTAITNPNTITLYTPSGNYRDFQEGYWFKYSAWNDTLCGYGRRGFSHGDIPPLLETTSEQGSGYLLTSLPALTFPVPVGGETGIQITVNKSNWTIPDVPAPTPSKPWRMFIGGVWWDGEMIEVTNISGSTLTITRGKWWHGKAWTCCVPGSPINIRFVNIMGRSYGPSNGLNNRMLTRFQAVMAVGLAFCGDYDKACTLLRKSVDYFQREGYSLAKDYVGLHNYSFGDYQFYRGIISTKIAAFLQNSTLSPSVDWISGRWIKDQGYLYSHWMLPWAPKEPIEVGQSKQFGCGQYGYNVTVECANGVAWLNMLFPSDPLTAYSWSFLKDSIGFNLHNGTVASVYGNGGAGLGDTSMFTFLSMFSGGVNSWPQAADRTTLPLGYVQNSGDSSQAGGKGYLTEAVRTDWGPNSSIFFATGIGSSDKFDDEGNPTVTHGFGKNGWLLYGPYASGGSGRHQRYTQTNTVIFGTATQTVFSNYTTCNYTNFPLGRCPEKPLPAHGTVKTNSAWSAIDNQYMFKKPTAPSAVPTYWLTNGGQANLHGLNYNWRNIFYFKLAGKRERVVVFDDISKTVAEKIRVLNHYPQNGEVRDTLPDNGGRHYTEGNTRISADFTHLDTRTGADEGGVVKMVSSYLCAGDATCDDFYDMTVESISAAWPNQAVSVCPNASASYPCSVKLGAFSQTYTSPIGNISHQQSSAASANNNTNAKIWAYLDPADGIVKVGWTSQVSIVPVCTGSVSCIGVVTDQPAGTLLLYFYRYAQSGSFEVGCRPKMKWGSESLGPVPVGNCFQASRSTYGSSYTEAVDNAVSTSMQTNSTACNSAGCRIYTVHEISEDLAITPSSKSELSVTSGAGVFKGIVIDEDGTNAAIAIAPVAQARTTTLGFTNPSSTTTHAVVAGLVEGTYRVTCGGVNHQTGISLVQGEAMLEVTNLPGGCVAVIERTDGVSINIAASPSNVSASCIVSGSNPSNQLVAIGASGGTLTNVSQSKVNSVSWLTVTPTSLSATGNFTFAFSCSGLSAATYTETVRFISSQAEVTNTVDVPVTLTVSNPVTPTITVNPTTLTFAAIQGGGNPAAQNVAVTVANGPLTISVADNQAYCAASTSSFSGSAVATNVAISMTTGALTAGAYPCTVTFSGSGATDKTVAVTFNVASNPAITLNVGSVTAFETTVGGDAPDTKEMTFSSSSPIDNWTLSTVYAQGSNWLSASSSSGTTATNITLTVDPTSLLVAGRYCATVSIASTTANVNNSPASREVCVDMLATPQISVGGSPDIEFGVATEIGLSVTGGAATYTWSVVGSLPTGFSVSGATGSTISLSGTATTIGDSPVTINVYDGNGAQATLDLLLKVRPSPTATDIEVTPEKFEGGVILRIRKSGLNANQEGVVVIRDNEGRRVASSVLERGLAVKTVPFTGLTSTFSYIYEILYPSGTIASSTAILARGTFTVDTVTGASGSFYFAAKPPSTGDAIGFDVYLGPNQAEVDSMNTTPVRILCTYPDFCATSITRTKGLHYLKYVPRKVDDSAAGAASITQPVRVQ